MTALTAEDADLVSRLRRGDGTAARELYQRHGAALLRFGLAMCNSRPTAEDIVHDTFVEILRSPVKFDPSRGSVLAYLFGIARHRMSRVARVSLRDAGARLADPTAGDDGFDIVTGLPESAMRDGAQDAGDEIDRANDIERVRAAVFELPRVHREVIVLCDLEELSYATAAEILGCPIGTVRSRLSRARALLATRLEPLDTEDDADAFRKPTSEELGVDESALSLSCRGSLT
ncbi:MAG: RNA polymerase sigma factor [Gammaproteobacteria bacterium]